MHLHQLPQSPVGQEGMGVQDSVFWLAHFHNRTFADWTLSRLAMVRPAVQAELRDIHLEAARRAEGVPAVWRIYHVETGPICRNETLVLKLRENHRLT